MSERIKNGLRKTISGAAYCLKRPINPEKNLAQAKTVSCTRESVDVLSSTSVVFRIVTEELDGYFFECRRHLPIKEYVHAFVEDYYTCIVPDLPTNSEDKQCILASLQDPQNFKRFISMGARLYNLKSPCMEFLNTGCGNVVGLNTDPRNANQINRLKRFVAEYAWCQINSYHVNSSVAENALQTRDANVALASQEVAKMLRMEHFVPKAEYIRLIIDGKMDQYGLFVEKAKGCSILPYCSEERKKKITPFLQRDLMKLNVLDIITQDQDHSPNNYNVLLDEQGSAVGISAFDNKSAGAFSFHTDIDFLSYKGCSAFVCKNGTVNRPYLSKEQIGHVFALTLPVFFKALRPYITPLQILCAWMRTAQLKKAVKRTLRSRKDFLLEDSAWTQETVEEELSGTYGKTYLISFFSDVFLY